MRIFTKRAEITLRRVSCDASAVSGASLGVYWILARTSSDVTSLGNDAVKLEEGRVVLHRVIGRIVEAVFAIIAIIDGVIARIASARRTQPAWPEASPMPRRSFSSSIPRILNPLRVHLSIKRANPPSRHWMARPMRTMVAPRQYLRNNRCSSRLKVHGAPYRCHVPQGRFAPHRAARAGA